MVTLKRFVAYTPPVSQYVLFGITSVSALFRESSAAFRIAVLFTAVDLSGPGVPLYWYTAALVSGYRRATMVTIRRTMLCTVTATEVHEAGPARSGNRKTEEDEEDEETKTGRCWGGVFRGL